MARLQGDDDSFLFPRHFFKMCGGIRYCRAPEGLSMQSTDFTVGAEPSVPGINSGLPNLGIDLEFAPQALHPRAALSETKAGRAGCIGVSMSKFCDDDPNQTKPRHIADVVEQSRRAGPGVDSLEELLISTVSPMPPEVKQPVGASKAVGATPRRIKSFLEVASSKQSWSSSRTNDPLQTRTNRDHVLMERIPETNDFPQSPALRELQAHDREANSENSPLQAPAMGPPEGETVFTVETAVGPTRPHTTRPLKEHTADGEVPLREEDFEGPGFQTPTMLVDSAHIPHIITNGQTISAPTRTPHETVHGESLAKDRPIEEQVSAVASANYQISCTSASTETLASLEVDRQRTMITLELAAPTEAVAAEVALGETLKSEECVVTSGDGKTIQESEQICEADSIGSLFGGKIAMLESVSTAAPVHHQHVCDTSRTSETKDVTNSADNAPHDAVGQHGMTALRLADLVDQEVIDQILGEGSSSKSKFAGFDMDGKAIHKARKNCAGTVGDEETLVMVEARSNAQVFDPWEVEEDPPFMPPAMHTADLPRHLTPRKERPDEGGSTSARRHSIQKPSLKKAGSGDSAKNGPRKDLRFDVPADHDDAKPLSTKKDKIMWELLPQASPPTSRAKNPSRGRRMP